MKECLSEQPRCTREASSDSSERLAMQAGVTCPCGPPPSLMTLISVSNDLSRKKASCKIFGKSRSLDVGLLGPDFGNRAHGKMVQVRLIGGSQPLS